MLTEWPFVGRRPELGVIKQALTQGPGAVVIAGPAGVGKTRMAREALELAEAEGFTTLWAQATHSAQAIPFGALAHLLPVVQQAPAGMTNLLRTLAQSLGEQAGGKRPALGVDDAHLLDNSSAALVHHLATSGIGAIVAAVRSGEPTPDPILALWKDGPAQRLELPSLSLDEVEELLNTILEAQVERTTVWQLWNGTRGSPLFLRELLVGGLEAGYLSRVAGVWRWSGPLAATSRLTEIIEARFGALDPPARELLQTVAGVESVELKLVVDPASPLLEDLERRGIVEEQVEERRTRVSLVHPLYGEVIRSSTAPGRRRVIMGQLAEGLEATGARRREDLLRLVTWKLEAGGSVTPARLVDAARRAMAGLDHRLAERLARAAYRQRELEGGLVLSEALAAQTKVQEAEVVLASLARQAESDTDRARIAIAQSMQFSLNQSRLDRSLALLREIEPELTEPTAKTDLMAARAYLLFQKGKVVEATRLGYSLLGSPYSSPGATLWTVGAVSGGLLYSGSIQEALQVLDEQEERVLPIMSQTLWGPIGFDLYRFLGRYLMGDAKQAKAFAQAVAKRLTQTGVQWAAGMFTGAEGMAACLQGNAQEGARLLRECVVLLREATLTMELPPALAALSHCLALEGQAEESERTLAEAMSLLTPEAGYSRGFIAQARVWVSVAEGQVSKAISGALEDTAVLDEMGFGPQQAWVLHDVARLGEPGLVVESLQRLAERCDGPLVPAMALHSRALAKRDSPGVEQASRLFEEESGAILLSAEAAAEAARIHSEQGKTGRAAAAAERARSLAAQCQGARTPALSNFEVPLPLTRREREIAWLAAQGLSSRDIGEQLGVSVRTIDNHLLHVYSKLNVSGREELVKVLRTSFC